MDTSALQKIDFLRSLRAVRRFAPTPIPDDALDAILDVARWTGSAKNTQPWHLVAVRSRDALKTLSECGTYAGHLAGAALAIVLVMDDENRRLDEGRLAQNLMLAGWAFEIGSCIGTIAPDNNKARARAVLAIPDDRWVHTAISFGYPADAAALRLSADRGTLTEVPIGRQPASDMVSFERFGQSNR
jgi:nitroreductase